MKNKQLAARISIVMVASMLTISAFAQTASATILFQDDTFDQVLSDAIMIGSNDAGAVNNAIQFGNNVTASENGVLTWDITTNSFSFDHTVNVTGGLSATGQVNFSGAAGMRLRESADPSTLAACTTAGEVIINTTSNRLEICTTPGAPGAATWVLNPSTIPQGAANPGTCAEGDLFYNTTDNVLYVCTATNTFTPVGPEDFEDIYTQDADKTLTTAGGNFTITTGGGNLNHNLTGGEFDITSTGLIDFNSASFELDTTGAVSIDAGAASNLTTSAGDLTLSATTGSTNLLGGEAAADAVRINASNAGGGIDVDAGTAGITLDSTGALSFDGTGASNFTTVSGALTLSTTTTGAVNVTAADNVNLTSGAGDDIALLSGDDITFDDAQLAAPIQLTNTATAFAATLTGGGIVDNLNSFTTTTAGEGASNVGINDAGNYYTGADVEAALQELGAVTGSNAPNTEVLSFHPEYPDTVIFPDGTSNNGTMQSLYDDTNDEHYYEWSTNALIGTHDMDLRFRFPLPADFLDVNDFTFRFRTGTTTEADNDVEVRVYNATNETAGDPTLCGSDTTNTSANAWTTGTITEATLETGCTGGTVLNAGDIIEVALKLFDNSGAADFADAGLLTLGYDN